MTKFYQFKGQQHQKNKIERKGFQAKFKVYIVIFLQ